MNATWCDNVNELLKRFGFSERDLAGKSGVPQMSVNRYLKGKRCENRTALLRLNRGMSELTGIPIVEIYLNWFWLYESFVADHKNTGKAKKIYEDTDVVELVSSWLGEFEERLRSDYVATITKSITMSPVSKVMSFVTELYEVTFERIIREVDMRKPARSRFDELMEICSRYLSGDIMKTADFVEIHKLTDQVELVIMSAISITTDLALVKKKRDGELVRVQLEQEARTRDFVLNLLKRVISGHFRIEARLVMALINPETKMEGDIERFRRRLAELQASDLKEFGEIPGVY